MLTYHDSQQISPEEQHLYDHLLHWVELESPQQLIQRFKCLFIDGQSYSDPEIRDALQKILAAKQANQNFKFVLNRCARILINHWLMQSGSGSHEPVLQLVQMLGNPPSRFSQTQTARRLRNLLQSFTRSEEYLNLQRLVQNLQRALRVEDEGEKPLGTLIRRYPYLYQHCILDGNSTFEHQQRIVAVQLKRQRQFEIDLSQYFIARVREVRQKRSITATPGLILDPPKNPTLLSQPSLDFALKHFAGRVNGATHRDLARQFLIYSRQTRTYRDFKQDLYEYLTAAIDLDYGKHQFNHQLWEQLQKILPECESQPLNEFLLLRTCSKLLNFLVVESPQHPQHYVFLDLANNIGATRTIALLLKIVLLCSKVRPHLDKRFSILFNHYRADTRDEVFWLVESLENLNVACSIHFGKVRFPGLR